MKTNLLSAALILNSAFLILNSPTAEAQNYQVTTVAGNGTQGLVDGACITTAELYWPYGVAYDGDSVIYFADTYNSTIRKLSANTHLVTTIAGTGAVGLQNGACATATFNYPDGVIYKNGILYIGDNMNNCIRKIVLSSGVVSTYAGTGVAGFQDGVASTAMFRGGDGIALAIDNNNNVYVADGANAVVRMISSTGMVSTVAGTPGTFGYVNGAASAARFARPRYLALDTVSGALYITDINNNVIRKLYNNQVSTFSGTGVAGGADGTFNTATFSAPVGISITANRNFYVIDGGGNKLRKVDTTGAVSTIAGNGIFGFQDGPAVSAEFYYPQGVCYDKHGYIYLADRNNNRIRKISVPECGDCAGINQLIGNSQQVLVYPNPSSGSFQVSFSGNNEKASIEIYNTIGECVHRQIATSSNSQINVSNLSEGVYNLSISSNEGVVNKRVIIAR